MAVPAETFDEGPFVEERIARLEEKTSHIQSDITEMKADIHRLEEKVDSVKDSVATLEARTTEKFAALEGRIAERFSAVDAAIARLNVGRMQDRVWWLLIAGAILGVLARGFKWV